MDYEKKYKEALERARNLHKDAIDIDDNICAKQCEIIFPELKESKDDKIKKIISGWIYTRPASFFDNGISKEEMFDWLEKQGNKSQCKTALETIKENDRSETLREFRGYLHDRLLYTFPLHWVDNIQVKDGIMIVSYYNEMQYNAETGEEPLVEIKVDEICIK